MSYRNSVAVDGRTTTLASTAGAIEYEMPSDFTTCLIRITQQGDATTDASTHAERMAGLGVIEVITERGGEIYIEAEDAFHLSGYLDPTAVGSDFAGAAANKEMAMSLYIPLSIGPRTWWDKSGNLFGLPGNLSNKLRITWDSDTNAGCDSRQATVQFEGIAGVTPTHYLTYRQHSYTAAVGAYQTERISGKGKLRGVFGFTTTDLNVDSAETTLGVRQCEVRVNEIPKLEAKTIGFQMGANGLLADDPAGQTGTMDAKYWIWDFDLPKVGQGFPIVPDMKVYNEGGVAEAVRVYPLVYRAV